MTKREDLYSGISSAAWAYLFLYFDINLGSVSILPVFVGYLMFLSAIKWLAVERRDLNLLRPLGLFLVAMHLTNWLLSWGGQTLTGRFALLDLLISVAALYFHFQLFTDFAAIAKTYQQEDDTLDASLLRWRTVQTVLNTLIVFMEYPSLWFDWWDILTIGLAVIYLVAGLCLMSSLFRLRRLFRENSAALDL